MLLQIHIVAGVLAMILGAVALVARKGARVHRRSGQLFVCSMLTMGITASFLGPIANGLMPAYFVVTALTTVRPVAAWTRWVNVSALLVAVVLALGSMAKGLTAFGTPGRTLNGVPFFMLFFIGTVMAIAAAGDIRVMWSGPRRGVPRLARHLWRMCFALFIAAGSFFSIQARVAKLLPEPFTTPAMRVLPIALIFMAMFYWLWRVRRGRTLPVLVRHEPMPLTTPAE
ncbi:MAG TPA: DUF2306 domain-containing protein [Thermoanaerobaculia bacterium]|nr:DUF2306 domain-containing protein [Thermoanaerobaculia bacterium]